jgi:hypothetical protein
MEKYQIAKDLVFADIITETSPADVRAAFYLQNSITAIDSRHIVVFNIESGQREIHPRH